MTLAWMALIATIVCSSGGNVFANLSHNFTGFRRLAVLGLACGVHGLGLVFFSVALTGIPLAITYPLLIGGSMIVVTTFAVIMFREHLTPQHLVGLAFITLGMILIKGFGQTMPVDSGTILLALGK